MMKRKFSTEVKVGIFVLVAILIFAYITIDVSQLGLTPGGTYKIYTSMDNAEGVTFKTPVQIAGIPVGVVSEVKLTPDQKARVELEIKKGVAVHENVQAEIRTRGVLGDTYIELFPAQTPGAPLHEGESISRVKEPADYQELIRNLSAVTEDLKEISAAMKVYTVSDKSSTAIILKNMEIITQNIAAISNNNMKNINEILSNLQALSVDLRRLSQNSSDDIELAMQRMASITGKIENGQGTLGKLLNDSATIDKTNTVLDNIDELTQGFGRMKTELGYHLEYLGQSKDVKNYISLKLQPKPDKFFLFEVVHDPSPEGSSNREVTTVSSNGVTSTIRTEVEKFNNVRFSAQIAKKFEDFTVRGGLIESTGGVGLDYTKGPVEMQFSAFSFSDRPHLKFLTQLNLTSAIYLLGGVDDFIAKDQDPDWFLGAGIRFTDDDIKSLIGAASMAN